jgi:hypothetical protein
MRFSLCRNICQLPGDGTQRSEIDIHSIDKHLPPELQYACRYWAEHLALCQDPINELASAFSTLKEHLHWVEVMSILGLISEAVGAMKRLRPAIQVSSPKVRVYSIYSAYMGVEFATKFT